MNITKEEALEELHRLTFNLDFEEGTSEDEADRVVEVLNMAIQALEERKTGKWIIDRHWSNISLTSFHYEVHCSICGYHGAYTTDKKDGFLYSNFCPNCGAKMVEPQESEDKDE